MRAGTEKVAFIGLGTMGGPMVANVVKGGFEVYLYDADPERASILADQLDTGAETRVHAARTPGDLQDCTVVVLMLPNSAIVRSVLLTQDGGLQLPLQPGSVIIDMSSSDPTETVSTGAALSTHGLSMIDAPVSGAKARALDATLAIMMGADDEAAAQRAIPVVDTMSRSIYRTGKLGTGHAMKALNNFVAAASFAAASEAVTAGERFGLDPALMVDILNDSTGQSFITSHVLGPHVVEGRFASGFALPLLTKDVRIAESLQRSVHHESPVCDAVSRQFGAALEELGDVDHTEAFSYWNTN
ncbi:NAD(P)-dependent oxidoreductase [Nesterenkonia lutea]|uniref:3-hydroxyisobutyrate dehydrogenase n=1 Tax=Nesterenkonia lutea TaxID=272919 RepID=A0ABR9JGR6_9MICC|nr:NAD(P)-dependent oxidoreductase [Nesterenkonia lutea]MBE1525122.1 3-hydroxyisobutyrate dehydrogenase [Nesterenkonia lutea]